MTAPFDIFQAESNGSVRWLGSAENIADAKARIQEQPANSPGEYLILNQQSGSKLVIKLDDIDTEACRRSEPRHGQKGAQ
jgi:hypothetical protein